MKIQKKKFFFFFFGGGGSGGGGGGVGSGEVRWGGWGWWGGGVRVDVNAMLGSGVMWGMGDVNQE